MAIILKLKKATFSNVKQEMGRHQNFTFSPKRFIEQIVVLLLLGLYLMEELTVSKLKKLNAHALFILKILYL